MHHFLCVRTYNAFIAVFQGHKSNGKGIRNSKSAMDLLYACVCGSVFIKRGVYVSYGCASEVQDIRQSAWPCFEHVHMSL